MPDISLKLKTAWLRVIDEAAKVKKRQFGDDADMCMRFFNGPYDFMYELTHAGKPGSFRYGGDNGDSTFRMPSWRMSVNKVAEGVQLFGPVLYHKNPNRKVNPRQFPMVPMELFGNPGDPNVQAQFLSQQQVVAQQRAADSARGALLESYLNYTPQALDLKVNMRRAIDEAMIKGMGVIWHETYTPRGSGWKMFGSFYMSVDDLILDPDHELRDDCLWIARRCVHPTWQVEREYGLPLGTIKGNAESISKSRMVNDRPDGKNWRDRQLTNDLVEYWKVYSRMGIGNLLKGFDNESSMETDDLNNLGPYTKLVVCDSVDYPLNLPPEIWGNLQAMQQATAWETPFWIDDAWPFTEFVFHDVPNQIWPMSHFKPAMGELQFMNWVYSFLASKVHKTSRDLVVVAESISEELTRAIKFGNDLDLATIKLSNGMKVSDLIELFQYPPFNKDILEVLNLVEDNFEKRTGLSELMYGMSARQMRSASEAQVKADKLSVRPDDMANKVEDAASNCARREAIGARWHLEPQDLVPVIGEIGAMWWQQLLTPMDPSQMIHQLEYTIEAGSIRKKNRDKDMEDARNLMQNLSAPFFQVYSGLGNPDPFNALLATVGKANDIDVTKMLLPPPPPPPAMPTGPAPGPQPGQGNQQ